MERGKGVVQMYEVIIIGIELCFPLAIFGMSGMIIRAVETRRLKKRKKRRANRSTSSVN